MIGPASTSCLRTTSIRRLRPSSDLAPSTTMSPGFANTTLSAGVTGAPNDREADVALYCAPVGDTESLRPLGFYADRFEERPRHPRQFAPRVDHDVRDLRRDPTLRRVLDRDRRSKDSHFVQHKT